MAASYPRDLIVPLRDYVQSLATGKMHQWPRPFPLPDESIIAVLLDQAYHASFQTEEGRRPGFRLLFSSLDETKVRPHLKSEIPKSRVIRFEQPRPFTSGELIRIAPAAEMNRFLICVQNTGSTESPKLEIWGLLDVGENWSQFVRHETSSGTPPPNNLTITSTAPGELTLSAGGDIFLTLKNGSILRPSGHALWNGAIADHLASARSALYTDVVQQLGKHRFDDQGDDDDYPKRAHTHFLERILHNIRLRAHGGTLLLVPDAISPSDTRLTDRVTVKYPCVYNHAWGSLIASLRNHRQYFDLYFPLSDGRRELNKDTFHEHNRLKDESEEVENALADIAQSVAALTAVDGAVVMTDRFRIFGFGAEVICQSPSLTSVRIAESDGTLPISAVGTRHRAAFRFCSSYEDAIAFVVSHDGGVKAVKRVGPDVLLWPDINSGAFGL